MDDGRQLALLPQNHEKRFPSPKISNKFIVGRSEMIIFPDFGKVLSYVFFPYFYICVVLFNPFYYRIRRNTHKELIPMATIAFHGFISRMRASQLPLPCFPVRMATKGMLDV